MGSCWSVSSVLTIESRMLWFGSIFYTCKTFFNGVCVCVIQCCPSSLTKLMWSIFISNLQSGCCKPPTECGYTYVNETVWIPGGDMIGQNPDCMLWNNDQRLLCYQCSSCKAGVLGSLKQSWRKVSVINIVVLIILVIFYVIAYAAYRNVKRMDNDEPAGEARMTKSHPSHFEIWWL